MKHWLFSPKNQVVFTLLSASVDATPPSLHLTAPVYNQNKPRSCFFACFLLNMFMFYLPRLWEDCQWVRRGGGALRRQRGREVMCFPACLLIIQQMYEAGCWSQNRWQERAGQQGGREQPEVREGRKNNTGHQGDLKDGQCRNGWQLRLASST